MCSSDFGGLDVVLGDGDLDNMAKHAVATLNLGHEAFDLFLNAQCRWQNPATSNTPDPRS